MTRIHTTRWYPLGILLDLDDYKLQQIRTDAKDSQEQLRMMFQTWLSISTSPSWEDVVKALKGIGENNLGTKLEQEFCN